MKENKNIDPKSGFCAKTKTFHSLRAPPPLPPVTRPLCITQYATTLLHSSATFSPSATFLINAATDHRLSYSQFLHQTSSLSASLQSQYPSLLSPNPKTNKQNVALIISPPSFHVPVLYFSLLSLNVIISPANPLSTPSELAHIVQLSRPLIAFATSSVVKNIPSLPLPTVLIDSPHFSQMLSNSKLPPVVHCNQSDSAAILYSSGTTGRVKGVELTHRNLISIVSSFYHNRFFGDIQRPQGVSLFSLPLFHVFGFFMLVRSFAFGDCLALMERFHFENMLKAVAKYKVTHIPVSPPLVVGMIKSHLTQNYDLTSLELLSCGGAALGKDIAQKFTAKFPNVYIVQGYGMTETGGGSTAAFGPDDVKRYGSAGHLFPHHVAKIIDPATGEALQPTQQGELWLRGPSIMKGYVGDDEATAATLNSDGWLRTGDLCYFDSQGFLFIVDRLKELIKYKAYQVPPAELEHILHSCPGIADVAVIPYPDEEAGQIPMAYVVRSPGSSITESQVMDFVAKQVSPYKKIRRVAFINSIPKSEAGKILRRELVNHATSNASAKL